MKSYPFHAFSWNLVPINSFRICGRIFQPHVHRTNDMLPKVVETVPHMMDSSVLPFVVYLVVRTEYVEGDVVDSSFVYRVNVFLFRNGIS